MGDMCSFPPTPNIFAAVFFDHLYNRKDIRRMELVSVLYLSAGMNVPNEITHFLPERRPCEKHVSRVGEPMPGLYVPQCDVTGQYQHKQCHGSTGYCWCVDSEGSELPGTKRRGEVQCNRCE